MGLILGVVFGGVSISPVRADTPTPTAGATPEFTTVLSSTPVPTWTPVPTSTPTPVPRITAKAEKPARHTRHNSTKHKSKSKPTSKATPTPTHIARKTHRKLHRKSRKKATPTSTPSPTPTATPALNLTAEDSVAPVTCNGPKRPVTTHPFLTPPYHGSTSIVSIFDHDSPNFVNDGLTVATTGAQAVPDQTHHRTDFPAYWNSELRQYLDYDGHNGYDYDLSYQPVYAAAGGKVIFAALEYPDAPDHGYGNMIMIDHHNGYVTLYGHFSKFLVKVGQKVRRGQKIGISGNTGHSTGPHLHFTVFHNCSPTDPYGWSGSGEDPLVSYQGETSVNLWSRAPEIDNPLPGWPGLSSLPAVPVSRRLLLRLPSTRAGAGAFQSSLHKRALRVSAALRTYGVRAHVDMLRGAVDISAPISPSSLYRLPFVVSIESPDSVDGTKSEVLAAVARAELSTETHRAPLAHSRTWTGYLVNWAGRTVLVGSGAKGKEVALPLPHGMRRVATERLHADPRDGLYAVDLGTLSSGQFRAMARALSGAVTKPHPAVAKVHVAHTAAAVHRESGGGGISPGLAIPAIFLVLVVAGGVALRFRSPKPEAGD